MQERKEYFDGEKAYKSGKEYYANPYYIDQWTGVRSEQYRKHEAWSRGFNDAEFDANDFAG
jgi:hypothetical protein